MLDTTALKFIRPLVARIMTEPNNPTVQWSVQGFGFLRMYFGLAADQPKRFRLNLWDSRFTVPHVSTVHDHPWAFTSLIVAGEFANQRYTATDFSPARNPLISSHAYTTIKTGVGGGLQKDDIEFCRLIPAQTEFYRPGDIYQQMAHEIHETKFEDGSVTINERVGDTEHARVFWPAGEDWVDAIPRPATAEEVHSAVTRSLQKWF